MEQAEQQYLTVAQAAALLQVSERTIKRYMERGLLEYSNVNPGGLRVNARFDRDEITRFFNENKASMKTPERPKRVYNRSIDSQKYARKKKKRPKLHKREAA